ncbi:peptidyl-prolyl cis-trans isomerase [Poseidonocella sp. HB161398]|uniref:peptidylprolyl isomerase n=1 Tax=Poseidonocella sp. HB161398 TaxID=2320855 RepID=UPI00110878BD|nr:peptidylprolyl isomerase [Poseidonocella sp. HB161398]
MAFTDALSATLRSPLVHFFMLGGLVFALYGLTAEPGVAPRLDDVITLTDAEADRLADDFHAGWGRAPTREEARALVRDWAIEEAMVREARALGLDQGDAMIRNRLRAKVEFLAEASAATLEPDAATLAAYYEVNAADYAEPARISLTQVLLPAAVSEAEAGALVAELRDGADPQDLGRATQLPPRIEAMALPALDRVFGAGFAAEVARLAPGTWTGPLTSAYGPHLLRLDAFTPGAVPPLDSLREKVLADWRYDEARRMRDRYTEELMSRYRLVLPGMAEVAE